jgi:hypothetical protein
MEEPVRKQSIKDPPFHLIPVSNAQIGLNFQSHRKKSNLDNKTCFGYPGVYCLRLWPLQYFGLSCPVVARRAKSEAETDTQLTIFHLSALKKRLPIYSFI